MRPRASARLRIAVAALLAAGAVVGMALAIVAIRSRESGTARLRFAASSPAGAPFGAFSQAHVAIGSRCLHVLVALSASQRVQGLRGVGALAPYDGMLFVNPSDTRVPFTMAETRMPLEITFFSAAGAPLGHAHMEPCPAGTDATCPEYASGVPYRYALEQASGSPAAAGPLGPCAA